MLKTNEITTTKLSNIGHSNQPTKGKYTMTNLYTALKTFLTSPRSTSKSTRLAHYRSTGMTGQVLASRQIEGKLKRVEKLFEKVHGVKLGRYKLYKSILPLARHCKEDTGGFIQYDAQAITGKLLDEMHKSLSSALKTGKEVVGVRLTVEEDYHFVIPNLRFIARGVRGKQKKVA